MLRRTLTLTLLALAGLLAPVSARETGSLYCSVLMTYDNAADFQDPQEEEPPPQGHQKPTMACTPHNRPDGKMPCTCLRQSPEGCKNGKRETEHASCNSWCWKDMCHCCQS